MALMRVVVKKAKLLTESTAQYVFIMRRGKAVPTGAEETMEIMCIHMDWLKQSTPPMTVRVQHAQALPAFSSSHKPSSSTHDSGSFSHEGLSWARLPSVQTVSMPWKRPLWLCR